MTTATTKLQKIRNQNLKQKAAIVLKKPYRHILGVEECYEGASVRLANGNTLNIPHEVWVLGWTEEEYIQSRR